METTKEMNINDLEKVVGGGEYEKVMSMMTPEERAEFERLRAAYEDACQRTRTHSITMEEYCRISDAYHHYYTRMAVRYLGW